MKYMNINGTTEPSFKLGTRGIVLSYDNVIDGQESIEQYRLKITEPNGTSHKVAYDTEIPMRYIVSIDSENGEEDGITVITIANSDGTTSNIRISSNTGSVKTTNELTTVGNIVMYANTDGKLIQDSGIAIANDIEHDSGLNLVTTGIIKEYIGDISEGLESVLNGNYYAIRGNRKYKVTYNDSTDQYTYIPVED